MLGAQVGVLHQISTIRQSFKLAVGSYTVSFAAAQRGNYQASSQTILVQFDGATIGTFVPSGTSYFSTNAFPVATAGTHTLSFLGTNPNGGDNAAFVGEISINVVPVPLAGCPQSLPQIPGASQR
jgi:hypothetical protein